MSNMNINTGGANYNYNTPKNIGGGSHYLSKAEEAAKQAKLVRDPSISVKDVVSQGSNLPVKSVSSKSIVTETGSKILVENNSLPSKTTFNSKDSEFLSNDLFRKRINIEQKILTVFGMIELNEGILAEREGALVAKSASFLQKMISPLANLTRADELATAQVTEDQANMLYVQGATSIATGLVSAGAGVGGLMNASEGPGEGKSTDLEEEENTQTNITNLEEDESETVSQDNEQTMTKEIEAGSTQEEQTIQDDNESNAERQENINNKNQESEDEPSSQHVSEFGGIDNESGTVKEAVAKSFKGNLKSLAKNVGPKFKGALKILGSQNQIFSVAISSMLNGAEKFYSGYKTMAVAEMQRKQAQYKYEKSTLQSYFELMNSNQNRLQSAIKNIEELKSSVSQAAREFNQANNQASRTIFS